MFSVLNSALAALSIVSGKPLKGNNVPLSIANYEKAFASCGQEICDLKSLDSVRDIYDPSGLNEYALFSFKDGQYVLLNKYMNECVESGYLCSSAYNNSYEFILKSGSEHFYYDYISNKFVSIETGKQMSNNRYMIDDWDPIKEPCISSQYTNATFINNSKYFDNLNCKYGNNDNNQCGIIASEILLGYYDSIVNDNVVSEEFDQSGLYLSKLLDSNESNYFNSPGTDLPLDTQNNRFRDFLIDIAIDVNNDNPINGMTNGQVYHLIDSYLSDQNVSYTLYGYPFSLNYSFVAEALIDNNKPFIASLSDHFVVVYGYDDDYYYFNVGWKDSKGEDTYRLPKQYFTDIDSPFILSLNISDHVHSNNFYKTDTYELLCGCGAHHSNRLIMDPCDWEFPGYYSMSYLDLNHYKDGLYFSSRRKRCGFIEQTVINLSPRKAYAGLAYLEVILPKLIYECNIEMAWWSANEYHEGQYSQFIYHTQNNDIDEWEIPYISLNTRNLNLSYKNLTNERFFLPSSSDGFGLYLTNYPIGDRNKGRLSLGRIIVDYYD